MIDRKPVDAISLPRNKIDWVIRLYSDGTIWAQSYGGGGSEVIKIYPWVQGEMGKFHV